MHWAEDQSPNEMYLIIIGDLNSECSYYTEGNLFDPLRLPKYDRIISDDQDTIVSANTCTYDRIIITSYENEWGGNAGVYRFDEIRSLTPDQAKKVSDHYPLWAIFYTSRDAD